jgi:hypothetical protein
MSEQASEKGEKKSERLEIRLSYTKKQAFLEACETQGDQPSDALRRFIQSYTRRAQADHVDFTVKNVLSRFRWPLIGGVLTMAILTAALLHKPSEPLVLPHNGPILSAKSGDFPPINYNLFAQYDANKNGVLDLGEIGERDTHLHRVLNLDGEAGIAPSEFFGKGRMQWNFVKPGSIKTHEEGDPSYQIEGDSLLVTFDLSQPSDPIINIEKPKSALTDETMSVEKGPFKTKTQTKRTFTSEAVDRSIVWEAGDTTPKLVFTSHDYRVRH